MASTAPASIPRWLAFHLVHQRERCKSAESRINLLLGTPPRYCDVDETRDWSRLSKSKRISFRLGADNIRNGFRRRKRRFTYPRQRTLRTFPQGRIGWSSPLLRQLLPRFTQKLSRVLES